jgi:MFS family permease
VIVGVLALVGVAAGPINPIYAIVLQEHTPSEMRGRVFGVVDSIAMAAMPLGMALGGFLIEGLGLVPTLVGMGAVYLAVTTSMFVNPSLRGMEKPASPVGGSTGAKEA